MMVFRTIVMWLIAAWLCVADGSFAPLAMDGLFPLEQVADAFRRSRTGRVLGKVGIQVAAGGGGGEGAGKSRPRL